MRIDHSMADRREHRAERVDNRLLVIYDQNLHHAAIMASSAARSGKATTTRVPLPPSNGDSTVIVPPNASTKPLAMNRPRPMPAFDPLPSPLKNLVKTRSRSASWMPGPRP